MRNIIIIIVIVIITVNKTTTHGVYISNDMAAMELAHLAKNNNSNNNNKNNDNNNNSRREKVQYTRAITRQHPAENQTLNQVITQHKRTG